MRKLSVFHTGSSLALMIAALRGSEAAAHPGHGIATANAEIAHLLLDWNHGGIVVATGLVWSLGAALYSGVTRRRRIGANETRA